MMYRLVKKSDGLYYLQFANGWLPFIGYCCWDDTTGYAISDRDEAIKKLHLMNKLAEKITIVEVIE